jgi:hypothetical protein
MFGFMGGESPDTAARKRIDMKAAQARWPFITNFDASTIRNEGQLIALVKDRSATSRQVAEADVRSWVSGKTFQEGASS